MAANIFNGVPHNHQASGTFPNDPTITYFFYYDGTINKVYKHDSTTNTTTIHDLGSGAGNYFPTLPTNQAMDRAVASGSSLYVKWQDPSTGYMQIRFSSRLSVGTGATPSNNDVLNGATTPNDMYACVINSAFTFAVSLPQSGWAVDHLYTIGNWGGTATPYNGLPQTQYRSMNRIQGNNTQINVFYDTGIVYTIDLSAQTVVSSAAYGATVVNIFNGVPWDHSASVSFDADPTITYFFRMDPTTNLNKVYIHDETSNTTTVSDIGIAAMFPSLPTNIPIRMGGEYPGGPNPDEHLISWLDTTIPAPNFLSTVVTSPTAVVVQQSAQNDPLVYHEGQSVEQVNAPNEKWYAHFSFDRWLAVRGSISHFLSTGSYGATGQPYAGLPYIAGGVGVETNYCSLLRVNGQENQMYLFTPTGDAIIMDLLAQQISSTVPYGPIAPPVVPPTPLPDIEVVYSAPSQFNLFSTDVSLVSETQYGWKFNKTLNDANKMELYLYHSNAPGAPAFNYNDLLQLTINMKNNLVLPAGEIFLNVYTGPPTAPNWYNYKDTYNFSPALGTTLDTDLVQHILNLTDARTDPILAISLHSNSAQQQINCEVSDVSFTILIPSSNSSQKVIVKLQNNFIVLDDKYWDLSQTAEGYNNTTLLQGFAINSWSPNIVAGKFPQSGTAKDDTAGTALYLAGTWQYWETVDGTTWTPTANSTLTWGPQNTGTVAPSIQSNGYAYIGTTGLTTNRDPVGFPTNYGPIIWDVSNTNQLDVTWVGYRPTSYTPLGLMTTPNNFTAAQKASGLFDATGVVGSTDIGVWISTATAPNGDPVADRNIVFNVLSDTQLTITRSWELNTTTYTQSLTSGREVTGQYVDPAYTTSVAPNKYIMPSDWVVDADNSFQYEILFSGGLGNMLPAESQNFRQMTVTPTPSAAITFTWTANYYTAGNILLGPVAGFTPTGLVSSFTTGGSLKPATAAYILYGCRSSENVDAFASLVFIEPEAPPEFDLLFNRGLLNQILSDASYTVNVSPVAVGVTYVITGKYYDINNGFLGDVTFTQQPTLVTFGFTFAGMPTGAKYISFVATSSDGVTAQLSLALCEPVPPTPPPPPPVITSVRTEEAIISKINFHVNESHKIIDDSIISELRFTLTDSDGRVKYTNDNIYYEIEVKEIDSNP